MGRNSFPRINSQVSDLSTYEQKPYQTGWSMNVCLPSGWINRLATVYLLITIFIEQFLYPNDIFQLSQQANTISAELWRDQLFLNFFFQWNQILSDCLPQLDEEIFLFSQANMISVEFWPDQAENIRFVRFLLFYLERWCPPI